MSPTMTDLRKAPETIQPDFVMNRDNKLNILYSDIVCLPPEIDARAPDDCPAHQSLDIRSRNFLPVMGRQKR